MALVNNHESLYIMSGDFNIVDYVYEISGRHAQP